MCEVDQSPSLRVKTKTKWNYNTAPPTCLHGVDRDDFIFYGTNKKLNYKTTHQ